MNEAPIYTVESISNSANPVQNITPPIDAIPTSTALDGAPKKKNYLPWLLGIFILVIILAASFLILASKSKSVPSGSIAQAPSPTTNPYACVTKYEKINLHYPTNTTSWETYTNSTQGYSFKYPNTLNLLKDKRLSLSTQAEVDKFCELGCEPSYGMNVETSVDSSDPQQNLKDYVTKTLDMPTCEQSGDRISTVRLYRTINLNNKYDAVYFQFNGCGGGSCDQFIIKDKTAGKIARFISMNLSEDLFNQIFSTFKFTNAQIESDDKTDQLTKLPEVPVYPQAKFTKKEFIPPCPGEQAVCNVDSYTWEFSGNIDEVISWYEQDQSKSAWKLAGGAGLQGTNRYGNFSNGKVRYWLTIYLLGPEGPVGIELRGPLNYQ